MIEAAIAAGADTAYLSGSGPTVAAITSGAAGDIFLQRTKERVDKQVNFGHSNGSTGLRCRPSINKPLITPNSARGSLLPYEDEVQDDSSFEASCGNGH